MTEQKISHFNKKKLTSVCQLLKHFDITIVDPTKPWKSENVGLWLQSEMFVRVTERTT
jgi:hypothetical protein